MPLYRISTDQKAIQIKPGSFSRQRDLQKFFEAKVAYQTKPRNQRSFTADFQVKYK